MGERDSVELGQAYEFRDGRDGLWLSIPFRIVDPELVPTRNYDAGAIYETITLSLDPKHDGDRILDLDSERCLLLNYTRFT